jgi:Cu+-exporting ATPase
MNSMGKRHMHRHRFGQHASSGQYYYCPMKCEGEKTYEQSGNCPVCNMKLVSVANK